MATRAKKTASRKVSSKAADRAREYRARKKAEREADERNEREATEQTQRATEAESARIQQEQTIQESAERATKDAAELSAKNECEAAEKKLQAERAKQRDLLTKALAGTCEAIADVAKTVLVDVRAPGIGRERADNMAQLWAPVLEPHINEDTAKWLPVAMASGMTAHALTGWVGELRQWREDNPEKHERIEPPAVQA